MTIDTVADIARVHGAGRPDAIAIIAGDRSITYGELDARSNRLAQALRVAGVQPDERVAFLDKNVPEYFETVLATAKLGAVTAAVNWRLAPAEVAFIVGDTGARVLLVGEELVPLVDAAAADGGLGAVETIVVVGGGGGADGSRPGYEAWIGAHEAVDPGVQGTGDDVAFQFYSSGTTGRPKGVMLTNGNCFSSVHANNDSLGFGPRSVNQVVMPTFHVAGGFWGMLGLYNGVPNVLMREVDLPQIVRDIEQYRVTHTVLVPAVIQFLLLLPETAEADFSSLELIVYGASPISEAVLTDAVRTFGCRFIQAYGMTETSGGCVLLPPEDHDPDGPNAHRLRAAGVAGPNTELKIVDAESLEEVPVGTVGEVLVRSPQNMVGYWRMPDATAATILPDGFLRTGDAGYVDDDGYLYIHDRVKDMIISGGENIYPAEVENVLLSHPGVADAAVIGIPSERWGETPLALVVRSPEVEVAADDLLSYTRERLAHYKCPTVVEFVEELPRNPSGKILKRELRAPYWGDRDRFVQ